MQDADAVARGFKMKTSVLFTVIVILLGSMLYFLVPGIGNSMMADMGFLEEGEYKSFMEPDTIKIFAYVPNNELAKFRAMEGNSIPEENSIVIGSSEAMMMIENKLIEKPGDEIKGFFGIDVVIEGIIMKTDSIMDEMHFLPKTLFEKIDGERNVFVKVKEHPDIYYTLRIGEPLNFKFREGSMNNYKLNLNAYTEYYPVVLGYKEAEIMRKNGDFSGVGDVMKDYYGYNVFIAGILEETGSIVDMMHFIPLTKDQMNEETAEEKVMFR